jgi:hypothetical protein
MRCRAFVRVFCAAAVHDPFVEPSARRSVSLPAQIAARSPKCHDYYRLPGGDVLRAELAEGLIGLDFRWFQLRQLLSATFPEGARFHSRHEPRERGCHQRRIQHGRSLNARVVNCRRIATEPGDAGDSESDADRSLQLSSRFLTACSRLDPCRIPCADRRLICFQSLFRSMWFAVALTPRSPNGRRTNLHAARRGKQISLSGPLRHDFRPGNHRQAGRTRDHGGPTISQSSAIRKRVLWPRPSPP